MGLRYSIVADRFCSINKILSYLKVDKFGNALIDDFELSFRLFRNGYKIAYAPLSRIYDQKLPTLELVVKRRSRWIKGHRDLLKHRTAEPRDIMGTIY
ncbi:MAG: glycosyltransferase [Nitrososphaeraceae archaeon]